MVGMKSGREEEDGIPGEEEGWCGRRHHAGAGGLFIFPLGEILIGVTGRAHEPGQVLLEGVLWLVPLVRVEHSINIFFAIVVVSLFLDTSPS